METVLNCSICLENIEDPKTLEKCNHTFCKICIDAWFETSKSCPYCRCNYGSDFNFYIDNEDPPINSRRNYSRRNARREYIRREQLRIDNLTQNISQLAVSENNEREYSSQENALRIAEYDGSSLEGLNFNGFEKITVSNCPNLTTISNFQNLRFLKIENCTNLRTISNLQNINTIRIHFCNNLTSIYNIRDSIDIEIAYCHALFNVFDFENINFIGISYCNAFSDTTRIANIASHLLISNCERIPSSIPTSSYRRSQNNYTYGRNVIYRTT